MDSAVEFSWYGGEVNMPLIPMVLLEARVCNGGFLSLEALLDVIVITMAFVSFAFLRHL